MKTRLLSGVVALCLMNLSLAVSAQDLEAIPSELAQGIGKLLAAEASKLEKQPVAISADSDKANGLHVPEQAGVLIVPQKDLKETEELAAQFKAEKGAPLGYLFLYHVMPIVKGQPVDSSHLSTIKITPDDGQTRTVHVLSLAVKQLSEDDYRLLVYGNGDKPLFDTKFSEGTADVPQPVGLSVKDKDDSAHQGTLVLTVFGKYQASFRAGHAE